MKAFALGSTSSLVTLRSTFIAFTLVGSWALSACGSGPSPGGTQVSADAALPGADGDGDAGAHASDAAMQAGPPPTDSPDLGMSPPPPSGIGPAGGSVNLLHVGITGDSRPPSCEDTAHYPSAIVTAIAKQFQQQKVDFALDLGDHMYVCNDDLPTATTQMGLYMSAIQSYVGTWFMTMGNHECWKGPCLQGSTNANYVAYMKALAPIASLPYYSFDVTTSKGLVTFVVVADNGWDSAQATWLESTLSTADAKAAYTIVARHHPEGDHTVSTNAASMTIIRAHKFALFLTGHDHLYKHMTTDSGRDLVFGAGGAPLIAGGAFHGYVILDQEASGDLKLTVYDVATNLVQDTWSVGPNQ
ncbi:MAG: metallophosphoesterase [Polyangia bacterium]